MAPLPSFTKERFTDAYNLLGLGLHIARIVIIQKRNALIFTSSLLDNDHPCYPSLKPIPISLIQYLYFFHFYFYRTQLLIGKKYIITRSYKYQ